VSQTSLWTNFDCLDREKIRVCFERSKPCPINLSLDLNGAWNPSFQIIPHATGRLEPLSIEGPSDNLEVVAFHLSHPAPLLKHFSIRSSLGYVSDHYPALPSALFNGDLSSIRTLSLCFVHTELPCRNIVNLTSFILSYTPPGVPSIERLLEFFENAPYLKQVVLYSVTPTARAQNGRLVSLARPKSMHIDEENLASILLDHLLIPVGVKLEIQANVFSPSIRVHLPRSLDNLKNFLNFTTIQLHVDGPSSGMKFSGPNGTVSTIFNDVPRDYTAVALESLAELNTSKTERLEIGCECLVQ